MPNSTSPAHSCAIGGAASNIVHVDDPGEGFDGGAALGTDLEAAGYRDFDFAGGEVEHHRDPAAAARFTGNHAFEARQGSGLANENPEPCRRMGNDRVERLDLLCRKP